MNNSGESKFKNERNAMDNYNYFSKFQKNIKPGISFKVHDGFYRTEVDRDGEHHSVWQVREPARYVIFSWKDSKGLSCAYPISFHLSESEFKEKLNNFIDTQPRIYVP